MKHSLLAKVSVALLLGTLAGTVVLAQNVPAGRGRGSSVPAVGQQRGTRAEACPAPACPKSGACPTQGQGSGSCLGKGQQGGNAGACPNPGQGGQGGGRGLRNGTGPRSQNGTCPTAPTAPVR